MGPLGNTLSPLDAPGYKGRRERVLVNAVMIMNCQPIIPSKMKVAILQASDSLWLEASRVTSEALSLDLDHDPADPICNCAHLSPGTTEYSKSY